jgi:signal transduction histidine kinase
MKTRLAERLTTRWLRLPRRTIRLRLTLVYGGLFLASGAALLTITYFLVAHQYTGRFFLDTGNGAAVKVVVKGNTAVAPSGKGNTAVASSGRAAGLLATAPEGLQLPILAAPSKQAVVAAAGAQSVAARRQLVVNSGIALGLMAVLSIWLGWIVAGRALRPLRTITNAAREISASNLHRRLALAGPDDELRQLANTFDDLLARLETSFAAQRSFVSNASHELRTPLTYERTLIEVALADPNATAETLRRTCERVLAAGEEQERLIEALLTLSRSQRGLERREPVDLAATAAAILDGVDRDGLTFATALEPARTSGDQRLVERLVANLVDNAVHYNVPGGRVEVSTGTHAGRAVLTVANTGPSVPETKIDRLFQPFERLENGRTGDSTGTGLGLSIVQAIATAHSAEVTARPRPDGGLRIETSFEAAIPVEPAQSARPG